MNEPRPWPTSGVASVLCSVLVALAACDELLVEPATAPATVAVSYDIGPTTAALLGETGEAFDKVDAVHVRIVGPDGTEVIHDETVAFQSTGGDTPLAPIAIVVGQDGATYRLEIEMLRNGQPMFSGSASLELVPGGATDVSVPVEAIPAGIVVDPVPPIDALGDTRVLTASVVFASGDEIPSAAVAWSSQNPSIVRVTTGGVLTSAGEGTATVVASHEGLSQSVAVVVAAVVTRVIVDPEDADAVLGATSQFQATALDRNENALVRTATWSSSDTEVATIDANGLASATGIGTTQITAEAGGQAGLASLTVRADPPEVTTRNATAITTNTATLHSDVNPNGLSSVAWFEWGPENDPGSFVETAERDMGSGFTGSAFSEVLSGLSPGTTYYYRAAARNQIGTNRGEILEFTTEPLLVIVTTGLPAGIPGFAYSAQLVATGGDGSYSWSLAGGALPAGLTLAADGLITGTPTETGTSQFTVRVVSGTQTETADLSIRVVESLEIVTDKLPDGVVGVGYGVQLQAQGGVGAYSWSLVSGALPSGVTLSPTGALSGVPNEAATFSFRVRVTSGPETATRDMTIRILQPSGRLTGTVTFAGSPLIAIQVLLTGPVTRATFTNILGQYSFAVLPEGTYTVTIVPGISEAVFGPLQKASFVPDGASAVLNFGGDGPPDLVITTPISVNPTAQWVNLSVTLSGWTVRNVGNGPSGFFNNRFYISTNSVISTFDTPITGNGNFSLAPGQSFTWGGPTLTIPGSLTPGSYYIGILVDYNNGVGESNEFNNYVSTPLTIRTPIGAPPGDDGSR